MSSSIFLSPDEFRDDENNLLGRANGNVYQRRQGLEGVHDGQIMIRLKKKRFIVIDYSIQPSDLDIQNAAMNPHVSIPKGAGRTVCNAANCNKVGMPVCLYDSEPTEATSLYLRSGLCFTCQRNLNEKRRTERKRPQGQNAAGPKAKKAKVTVGNPINFNNEDAMAIHGGHYHHDGYGGFQEIGADLQATTHQASFDVDRLLTAVSSNHDGVAAAAAVGDSAEGQSTEAVANAFLEAATMSSDFGPTSGFAPGHSPYGDVNALYEKACQSMKRASFLLTQWKASWDAAISAAHETVADPSFADAVASAAAVVAAGSEGPSDPTGSNMVSLLLAADKRKDDCDEMGTESTVGIPGYASV